MKSIANIETKRRKKTFYMSVEELKKGNWLKEIPDDTKLVELEYKQGYLKINTAYIKDLNKDEKSECK